MRRSSWLVLTNAATFSLDVTDGGGQHPDHYRMVVFDGGGASLYDVEDDTTPGLGNLAVSISAGG